MTTANATQLAALKTDVDAAASSASAAITAYQGKLAALNGITTWQAGSVLPEVRILGLQVGHLKYLLRKNQAASRFLASQITLVNGGGTSVVPVPTTSGSTSSDTRTPKPPGRGGAV